MNGWRDFLLLPLAALTLVAFYFGFAWFVITLTPVGQ
jgi:hypothetical protein